MSDKSIKQTFRYRARPDESIAVRHAFLMSRLTRIPKPWGLIAPLETPDIGPELVVTIALSSHLGEGLSGELAYLFRSPEYLRDESEYDDGMIVRCELSEFNLMDVATAFESYVEAFGPYRARVEQDTALLLDDWEAAKARGRVTGRDEDGRDNIYRIWPISFFDRELCRRAFGIPPELFVARVRTEVQSARIVSDGVILTETKVGSRDDFIGFDQKVRRLIENMD